MAIDYSGTSQHHLTSSTPVTAAPLSLACWFNTDDAVNDGCLVSVSDSATDVNSFELDLAGIGETAVSAQIRATTPDRALSTADFTTGTWYHACAVFASPTSRASYLDGGGKGTNATNLTPLSIDRLGLAARSGLSSLLSFNGRLAEVGIWNVALTDDEVAALARGFSPLCIQPQALVFYAPLVREVQDVRGGRTLTPTGSPTVAGHCRIIYPHKRIYPWGAAPPRTKTRLYLSAAAETVPISPTPDAAWEDQTILARVLCDITKRSLTMTDVAFADANAADRDVLFRQHISPPLVAGQTITGAQSIKAQFRVSEVDLGNNLFFALGIRVIAGDGTTVQKTVLSVTRDGLEAVTALTNRQFTATSAVTNYTTVAGDRLVLETGMGGDPGGGKDHDSTIRFGDASASDLSEDDTSTTDNNPWVELNDTLNFTTEAAAKKYTGGMYALRGERGSHRRTLVA